MNQEEKNLNLDQRDEQDEAGQETEAITDGQPEGPAGEEGPGQTEEASGQENAGQTEETPAEETVSAPEEPVTAPREKGSLGRVLRSEKFRRGGTATLMSVVFIAIVVVVNILVSVLTERFPSMNIDLTAQKLNSLSDQAIEIAKGVEQETTIYLIGDEEAYRKDRIYSGYNSSYGVNLQSSQVANLAEKLQEANSKITVEYIDPDTNPTFISQRAEHSLASGMVLLETEKRSRALSVGDLFSLGTNSSGTGYSSYSKVDSALAGALEMVNLDKVPVVTILTGHNELLSSSVMSYFIDELKSQNFDVQEVNILTEEIPEDTQVVMLPTPTRDYSAEELQKLRDFLDDETKAVPASLLVTCHPTQGEMPNLASFLEEWGVRVEQGIVAETDDSREVLGNAAYVFVDPDDEVLSGNTYKNLMSASSSPLTLLFEGNGDVSATALWTTADSAYVVTDDMTEDETPDTSAQVAASISAKYFQSEGESIRRSVVVFGSSYIFLDDFMGASAFDNKAYITDLMKYVTGTDGSAVSVLSNQVATNVMDVTASQSTVFFLGLGVFTIGIPLAILIAGLVIFLKRRHL